MGAIRRCAARLMHVLRPGRGEGGLARELSSHLTLLEDEYRRRGLTPDAARRAARLSLGGVEQTKELHRRARSVAWLDAGWRDVRDALRVLRRRPVVAAAAISSLALGIGLNAAVFSVVDWVLLRPLPYPAAHELVTVLGAGTAPVTPPAPFTYQEAGVIAKAPVLQQAMTYVAATRVVAAGRLEPAHTLVARVTGDPFGTFGITTAAGRPFTIQELASGAPVVVIDDALWSQGWQRDAAAIGRAIDIDNAPHQIVGVMPRRAGYPAGAQVWRPASAAERRSDDRDVALIARLRPRTTIATASEALAAIVSSRSGGTRTAWADDLQRADVRDVKTALAVLFAAAGLVMLVVCANVAALVGSRAADRAAEMHVRRALGATRRRLLAQSLIETGLLTMIGGAAGILAARGALAALVAMAPTSLPRLDEIALDGRIVAIGIAATALIALIVGILPAIEMSRAAGRAALRGAGIRHSSRATVRRALVVAQVTLTLMLAIGASLLTRSFRNVLSVDHGFEPDRLVLVQLYLRSFEGDPRQLFRDLIAAAETTPGVTAAAVAMRLPTQLTGLRTTITWGGSNAPAAAVFRPISQRYFATAGIPIRAGRAFDGQDRAGVPLVAVVNESFVRQALGGRDPLGMRITTSLTDGPVAIVGVAGDVTPGGEADRPAIYMPIEQTPIGGGSLVVRTAGAPEAVIGALAERVRQVSPGLPRDRISRVAAALEQRRAGLRFMAALASTFATLALLLSMIGVYSLAATEVTARWRELAIRLALGASHRRALGTVLKPSAIVIGSGIAIGLAGSLAAAPALRSLLRGVAPTDAWTFAITATALVATGALASCLAAARVLRADPAATLRTE